MLLPAVPAVAPIALPAAALTTAALLVTQGISMATGDQWSDTPIGRFQGWGRNKLLESLGAGKALEERDRAYEREALAMINAKRANRAAEIEALRQRALRGDRWAQEEYSRWFYANQRSRQRKSTESPRGAALDGRTAEANSRSTRHSR